MGATETQKQPKQVDYDIDDDSLYTTRNPSSTRRYQQPVAHDTIDDPLLQRGTVPRRRASVISNVPNASNSTLKSQISQKNQSKPLVHPAIPAIKLGPKRLPLLAVVVGMFVMALLVLGFSTVSAWWQVHLDDMQYGRPRTFQMDAVVGHQDSASNPTHFIFINLNRHVEIIELPGGDAAHARIYTGPILYGDGQDLTPITGEVRDVNGDGKPDLIVHIQDQQIVFINDGTQFRPLQPGEQIHL